MLESEDSREFKEGRMELRYTPMRTNKTRAKTLKTIRRKNEIKKIINKIADSAVKKLTCDRRRI